MSRTIKLIWDFKGENSEQTAKHHVIHLKEFIEKEKLELKEAGVKTLTDNHTIAYMNVLEKEVFPVRDALIPHRAVVV